jgi:hypothetical protein
MGNSVGATGTAKGMQAVARTTPNIELAEFGILLSELQSVALESASEWITKEKFEESLKKIEKFEPSDTDIFTKLFVLFDVNGNSTVYYKDFIAGAACCLSSATLPEKLKFAMAIYDTSRSSYCLKGDLKKLLYTINNVTSYFGDPVIRPNQIDAVVFDIYKANPSSAGKGISCETCIEALLANDIVKMFLRGEGRLRFGDPELKL